MFSWLNKHRLHSLRFFWDSSPLSPKERPSETTASDLDFERGKFTPRLRKDKLRFQIQTWSKLFKQVLYRPRRTSTANREWIARFLRLCQILGQIRVIIRVVSSARHGAARSWSVLWRRCDEPRSGRAFETRLSAQVVGGAEREVVVEVFDFCLFIGLIRERNSNDISLIFDLYKWPSWLETEAWLECRWFWRSRPQVEVEAAQVELVEADRV